MSTFMQAQIMLTFANLLITGAPLIADLNKTHATNPLWIGHARFHVVWQVLSYGCLGLLNMYIIWRKPSSESLAVSCAILACIIIGFFSAAFSVKRFGGAFYDEKGYLPFAHRTIMGRHVEFDVNAVGFSFFGLILMIAAAMSFYAP
ncbi:hypothetical protein QMZ05_06605 [Bradyrhizobium sp. INPA03-11B]|uniref:hypothetical protein n=1 Tax=Bradyrhizobium sp. INPA03-11B TaxID=418598 RepID=UPI00338E196F